jgi:hypothetical protein
MMRPTTTKTATTIILMCPTNQTATLISSSLKGNTQYFNFFKSLSEFPSIVSLNSSH